MRRVFHHTTFLLTSRLAEWSPAPAGERHVAIALVDGWIESDDRHKPQITDHGSEVPATFVSEEVSLTDVARWLHAV
jgi:hypothetical protein